jgi:hypothetical protein
LTPKTIFYDVVYLKPGTKDALLILDLYVNSESSCTKNECAATFEDSSGNVLAIAKHIGTGDFFYGTISSNLSGDWIGFVSCRTDS